MATTTILSRTLCFFVANLRDVVDDLFQVAHELSDFCVQGRLGTQSRPNPRPYKAHEPSFPPHVRTDVETYCIFRALDLLSC